MRILISGGCGFLGSNLAAEGIKRGHEIYVFDNLSRWGSDRNREWLNTIGSYGFIHGDVRNRDDIENIIKGVKFDAVFHLAGQVAMTTSIDNPYHDFQVNALGTIHVLDSIRKYSPDTVVVYSSTNKVYGDLEQYTYSENETRFLCSEYPDGFDENVPLDFRSPYGCSKGAADQYLQDFFRIFGIKTIVFRHSSMYGGQQYATYDQGWIGWFCQKAFEIKNGILKEPFTISGNGKQVRDLLHADDMVRLYYLALDLSDCIAGEVFNIGGGIDNSLSLIELFSILEDIYGIKMNYCSLPPRRSDQKVFVANIQKIKEAIGWVPAVSTNAGIEKMLKWIEEIN